MNNKDIVRNRRKITATIKNASIFKDIIKEYDSFDKYIWKFTDGKVIKNKTDIFNTTSELSDIISKDLYKRGMRFVGSTIIYSYLQAIGVIYSHTNECDMYKEGRK
jgi:DNA-3-methyladenine glycosylase I